MNRQPYEACAPRWEPRPHRAWIRLWRPLRRRRLQHGHRIREVQVDGLEHLQSAVARGEGVLVTPNHPGHADSYLLYEAADRAGLFFYFMAAWQVFEKATPLGRRILQHHGCFSVNRESFDRGAFRQAVEILEAARNPLVVFAEGDVYHLNDRVTPFFDGAAVMAATASRRAQQPVSCVPCALRYEYVEDPTEDLQAVMTRLERHLQWRPRPELPLVERLYRVAAGLLSLKEIEVLGAPQAETFPQRVEMLTRTLLERLEEPHGRDRSDGTPDRVKHLRRTILEKLSELATEDPQRVHLEHDLDEVFQVVQLYSYPGTYVAENPCLERVAETIDKLEEDVLGAGTASIRGCRRATVRFGESLRVTPDGGRDSAPAVTAELEQRVQSLLAGS